MALWEWSFAGKCDLVIVKNVNPSFMDNRQGWSDQPQSGLLAEGKNNAFVPNGFKYEL